MGLDALPARAFRREEIDVLKEGDGIQGVYPVYGARPEFRDQAHGVVLVVNGTAHALAYVGDEWESVETREVQANDGGIAWDDVDALTEMQDAIESVLVEDSSADVESGF